MGKLTEMAPEKGQEVRFPTNQDLANILGRTFDLRIILFYLFGFQLPSIWGIWPYIFGGTGPA